MLELFQEVEVEQIILRQGFFSDHSLHTESILADSVVGIELRVRNHRMNFELTQKRFTWLETEG